MHRVDVERAGHPRALHGRVLLAHGRRLHDDARSVDVEPGELARAERLGRDAAPGRRGGPGAAGEARRGGGVEPPPSPALPPPPQVNGARATLARYPNSNPELDLFPAGYVTGGGVWLPPADDEGTPFTYTVVLPPGQVRSS